MTFKMVFLPPQRQATRTWAEGLARDVPEAEIVIAESPDQARAEIVSADAAFGTLTPEVLAQATRLRWLAAPAIAPPAGFYYQALIDHPLVATNFREIFNDHISAHIMAFLLAFARGLHHYIPRQFQHTWQPEPREGGTVHLPESTALIIGVGGIGAETARLCAAFGIKVIGVDARREEKPLGVDEFYRPPSLDDLLPRADFVIMTIPHTPQTEGLMNADRLKLMKRSAFLINIGRGMTVRLDDLNAALRNGEIAGAALDVFEIEPLPADHPIWSAPNVLLTPHTAGYGPYLDDRRYEILLDNARRFAAGQPLRNEVDKAHWF